MLIGGFQCQVQEMKRLLRMDKDSFSGSMKSRRSFFSVTPKQILKIFSFASAMVARVTTEQIEGQFNDRRWKEESS